jgi:Trp operon repressor
MNTMPPQKKKLIDCLCMISEPETMEAVLAAVLTQKEIKEIENRLQIFEMLSQHIPQRDVAAALGVGIATVTRGAHAIREGQFDILEKCLVEVKKLSSKEDRP